MCSTISEEWQPALLRPASCRWDAVLCYWTQCRQSYFYYTHTEQPTWRVARTIYYHTHKWKSLGLIDIHYKFATHREIDKQMPKPFDSFCISISSFLSWSKFKTHRNSHAFGSKRAHESASLLELTLPLNAYPMYDGKWIAYPFIFSTLDIKSAFLTFCIKTLRKALLAVVFIKLNLLVIQY